VKSESTNAISFQISTGLYKGDSRVLLARCIDPFVEIARRFACGQVGDTTRILRVRVLHPERPGILYYLVLKY
jgi:hypothetical protein